MALGPCYTRERVEDLWAGRESLTLAEIAALDIPLADRLWCVLAPGVLPEAVLGELHCRIVDEAVAIYEKDHPNDPRPRRANEIHRAYLRGEATKEEWDAARAAAGAAAGDAAWDAAWAAAGAAAGAAALTRYLTWAVEAAEVVQ